MFVQLGLQLNSDMSMRICSEASIAESPLLAVVVLSPGVIINRISKPNVSYSPFIFSCII